MAGAVASFTICNGAGAACLAGWNAAFAIGEARADGITNGHALARQGAIAGATAAAMYQVGTTFKVTSANIQLDVLVENAVGHGVVGGLASMAQGGKFGSGFASGVVSGFADPYVANWTGNDPVAGAFAAAVVGGTTSVISGGKFANGAVTGAFGYLFNFLAHASFDRKTGVLDIVDSDSREVAGKFFSGSGAGDGIEPGIYAVLDRGGKDGFRLEAIDSNFGDDVNDGGQSLLRLHGPGRSYGCVTACDGANWAQVRAMIQGTAPSQMEVNTYRSLTLPGGHLLYRWQTGTETLKYYGNLWVH